MNPTAKPVLIFFLSFVALWFSARIGAFLRKRRSLLKDDERQDFGLVLAATLTLLGLLIGFAFSMAVNRYDLRKTCEEAEANAIGTEYLRADLLPPAEAAKVRDLLREYIRQRILFYTAPKAQQPRVNADTADLQNQLWAAVRPVAVAQPNPVNALVISGMNDTLNSQSYTQAAWWNRIPIEAWALMAAIAFCCNILIGYSVKTTVWGVFLILPTAVSISFLLIADIDSPRGGAIRVIPQNLVNLSQSLPGQ